MEAFNPVKLIVGLGNPGEEYENTYHNAGFLAVEEWTGEGSWSKDPQGTFSYMKRGEHIFLKPLTFMNLSGEAVLRAMKYFGLNAEDLLVIHDDADLPLGTFKLEKGRGSAGHHGIESITKALAGADFWRARIGIRGESKRDQKAGSFVLAPIPKTESGILYGVFGELKTIVIENVTPS